MNRRIGHHQAKNVKLPRKRGQPFMFLDLEHYKGELDELNPDYESEKDCGWCGKSLARIKVIYAISGDYCCSMKCCDKLDDWIFHHIIDPEDEIAEILGKK